MRKLCLPEDLHPGLTGQTGLETGPKCPVRVRSGILTRDLIGFRLLTGTDLPPYIYEGPRPIEGNPNRFNNSYFTFYL